MTTRQFIDKINSIIETDGRNVIDEDYVEIITDMAEKMADPDLFSPASLDELATIFNDIVIRAKTNDYQSVAQLLMARINGSKQLSMGQVNLFITMVGLAFRRGSEILVFIKSYNQAINEMCADKIALLTMLSANRKLQSTISDADEKRILRENDKNVIKAVIEQQMITL